jgi:hypothetical protein
MQRIATDAATLHRAKISPPRMGSPARAMTMVQIGRKPL